MERVYIYKGFERIWHWSQALIIGFLGLTGFEIHGSYSLLGFDFAVRWHTYAAWALVILIVFAIFWHFTTGEWRQYIPTTKMLKEQFMYYIGGIFNNAPHPTNKTVYNKFNPLQRMIYLGLKILVIPIIVTSGFLYLYFQYFWRIHSHCICNCTRLPDNCYRGKILVEYKGDDFRLGRNGRRRN